MLQTNQEIKFLEMKSRNNWITFIEPICAYSMVDSYASICVCVDVTKTHDKNLLGAALPWTTLSEKSMSANEYRIFAVIGLIGNIKLHFYKES